MLYNLLQLTFFTQHNSLKIHPIYVYVCVYIYSFHSKIQFKTSRGELLSIYSSYIYLFFVLSSFLISQVYLAIISSLSIPLEAGLLVSDSFSFISNESVFYFTFIAEEYPGTDIWIISFFISTWKILCYFPNKMNAKISTQSII